MAAEELAELEEKLPVLQKELRILVIPPDPNDSKNIYLEIRPGAGGEEAALFAALLGVSALSREEKEGTAELLLTHPLRRAEIVTQKLIAVLIQIVVLNVVVFLMTVGSIAVIVPTPNGAGPWHFAVKTMLILYGVADEHALYFVLIVHTVQTMLVVALGIYSWLALNFTSTRKHS
jgi:ABC-type transport system involved in multi-copper enzyme maturation permease subunit